MRGPYQLIAAHTTRTTARTRRRVSTSVDPNPAPVPTATSGAGAPDTDTPGTRVTVSEDYTAPLQGYIKPAVRSNDRTPETARLGGGYVHLSSLLDPCARAHVLATRMGGDVNRRPPSSGNVLLWALGRAAENHVVTSYLDATGREKAFGGWVCNCGSSVYSGLFNPDTAPCQTCGARPTNYQQLTLVDDDLEVIGNPDLMTLEPNGLLITEIKICDSG